MQIWANKYMVPFINPNNALFYAELQNWKKVRKNHDVKFVTI